MVRSFSNRIFGGVCGGLGNITPINAWIWRIIFILLTVLMPGVGALIYTLLWWVLPLDSPLHRTDGTTLPGLFAVLLSLGLIVSWFFRDSLLPAGAYWPIAILVLALVFFIRQLAAGRSGNIALGLVGLLIPLVFVLGAFDVLQGGAYDIALRAWPLVLIFFGLSVILRHRVPFGSGIALLISGLLVTGIVLYAYNSRTGVILTDQQIMVEETLSPVITTLQVNVTALDTDVHLSVAPDLRTITGQFIGSNNAALELDYSEEGTIATFTLTEDALNEFALLEDIGRGQLDLQLPSDVAVAIAFRGKRGTTTFDMASLRLERLNFDIEKGDVIVTLPQYQPLSPSVRENPGVWTIVEGDLRVLVPETVGVRFLLDRGRNQEPREGADGYDGLVYRVELESGDYVLVSRQYSALNVQVEYRIDLFGGSLDVDPTAASG